MISYAAKHTKLNAVSFDLLKHLNTVAWVCRCVLSYAPKHSLKSRNVIKLSADSLARTLPLGGNLTSYSFESNEV